MKTFGMIGKSIIYQSMVLIAESSLISLLFYTDVLLDPLGKSAPALAGFFGPLLLLFILPPAVLSSLIKAIYLRPLARVILPEGKDAVRFAKEDTRFKQAGLRLSRLARFTHLLHALLFAAAVPAGARIAGALPTFAHPKLAMYLLLGLAVALLFSILQTGIDHRRFAPCYRAFEALGARQKPKKTRFGMRFTLNLLFGSSLGAVLLFTVFKIDEYRSAIPGAAPSGAEPLLALGAVFLALGLPSVMSLATGFRRRIIDNRSFMENLLCGQDFFRNKLTVTQYDELGMLSVTTNRFIDRFREILEAIFSNTESVQSVSGSLDRSLSNASAAIEEMVAAMRQITSSASAQMNVVKTTSTKLEEMLVGIDGTSLDMAELSSFVQETSSAMHETTASIQTISKNTEQVNALATRLVDISSCGSGSVEQTIAAIKEIEKASGQVEHIVDIISNIAAQTNLLSLNAAIEAAHAGQSGRGFAVVAGEIRKLADQSNENIALIVEQIRNMRQRVESGVALTAQAGEAFASIHGDIVLTNQHIGQVSIALQEQNQGVREIMKALEEMVKKTSEVNEIAEDLKRMSGEIHKFMNELFAISTSINQATGEQNKGNSEILSLITTVKDASLKNLSVVDSLQAIINDYQMHKARRENPDKLVAAG